MAPIMAPDGNVHMFHPMEPMAAVRFLAIRLRRLLMIHRNTTLPHLPCTPRIYPNSPVIILQITAGLFLIYTTAPSCLHTNPLTTPRISEEYSLNP